MALPEDILTTINDLDRRLKSLETTPQPPSISLSETWSGSFSIADSGSPGNVVWVDVTLTADPDPSKRVLAMPSWSLYKNSVSASNLFPGGGNWSTADLTGLSVYSWIDWGLSDNANAVLRILLVNYSASSFNLVVTGNFRYLLNNASTA